VGGGNCIAKQASARHQHTIVLELLGKAAIICCHHLRLRRQHLGHQPGVRPWRRRIVFVGEKAAASSNPFAAFPVVAMCLGWLTGAKLGFLRMLKRLLPLPRGPFKDTVDESHQMHFTLR
jgi:hypothetical protein